MPVFLFVNILIFNKEITTVKANKIKTTKLFIVLQLNPSLHPHPNLSTRILFKGS